MKYKFLLLPVFALIVSVLLPACSGQDKLIAEGESFLLKKDFDKAIEVFGKAIEKAPNEMNALIGRGRAFAAKTEHDKALEDFNKAALGSGHDSVKAKAYFFRGLSHYALAHYPDAIKDLDAAINLNYSNLGDAYGYRAIIKGLSGNDFDAITDFNKSISINPNSHFVLSNRGYYNSKLGDNAMAIQDFTKAIELEKDDKVSYLNRGYTYLNMKDYERALQDFYKSYEIDTNYLGPVAYIGITLTNMGKNLDALPWHNKAIKFQPENGTLYYYRGVCRINLKNMKEGCEDLRIALSKGDPSGRGMLEDFCQ